MCVDYRSQKTIQQRPLWLPKASELSKTQFFLFHVKLKEIPKKRIFCSPEIFSNSWNTCLENIFLYSNILIDKAIAHCCIFWKHSRYIISFRHFLSQLQRQNMFIIENSKNWRKAPDNKITYNPTEYGKRQWSYEWNIFSNMQNIKFIHGSSFTIIIHFHSSHRIHSNLSSIYQWNIPNKFPKNLLLGGPYLHTQVTLVSSLVLLQHWCCWSFFCKHSFLIFYILLFIASSIHLVILH